MVVHLNFIIIMILSFIYYFIEEHNVVYILSNQKSIFMREIYGMFFHVDIYHLLMNCITVFILIDTNFRLLTIIYFIIANAILISCINLVYKTPLSVGFSGVLYSILTIYPNNTVYTFYMKSPLYTPILLIVNQFLFKDISFFGHLVGIMSGYLYLIL